MNFILYSLMTCATMSTEPVYLKIPSTPSCHNNTIVLATVRVDTIRNNYSEYGAIRNTVITYSVLSVSLFDTSIFKNTVDTAQIDTTEFPKFFVDSFRIKYPKFHAGDTLSDIFIAKSDCDSGKTFWTLGPQDTVFLRKLNPTFPLQNALNSLNEYFNRNHIYKGFHPPRNGILKLGPVFDFSTTGTDPGWKLCAYNDTAHWFLKFTDGAGDCVMGCTEFATTTYEISSNGDVNSLGCIGLDCPPIGIKPTQHVKSEKKSMKGLEIFSISGRRVAKILMPFSTTSPRIGAYFTLKPGIYFINASDHGKVRLFRVVQ